MSMSNNKISIEETIKGLEQIIEDFKNREFEGILFYGCSNKKKGWIQSNKGTAEDRLIMVHAAWMSMQNEPNEESRDWFFSEMYKLLSMLRPASLVEADNRMVS